MIITVDLESSQPLFAQIADGVRQALVAGTVQPGDRLPPGRELANTLAVNLETVQRAYRQLAEEGVVVSRVGRGTRVAESVDIDELGVTGLVDDLVTRDRRLGVSNERLHALIDARLKALGSS